MGELLRLPRSGVGSPAGPAASEGGSGPAAGWGERRLYWLLWSQCPGIASVRLPLLEAHFGSLRLAWQAPPAAIAALPGFGAVTLQAIERHRLRWGPAPLPAFAAAIEGGRRRLVPGDRRWPATMPLLERPPLVLHWRGQGSLWAPLARSEAIAVVGTRHPSSHGVVMARRIGATLACAGWPVVSGLAEGIDAAAHRGALAAGGSTVAVLGTPLDRVYPRHHGPLQEQIARQGLLVSEQWPGSQVRAGQFAARNRLQVALARAVVVVECPEHSGALHSARLAAQLQRPVWVVPADAGRMSALGSNRLLTTGATALVCPEDLLAALPTPPLPPAPAAPLPALSLDQQALLAAVGAGASLEELAERLGATQQQLAPQLLDLELGGVLQAAPGLVWRPA